MPAATPASSGAPPTNGDAAPAKPIGRLHVITDFHFQQRLSHAQLAREAIRGGADTIQFRQKEGSIRNILIEARQTQGVCRDTSIPLLINDHVAITQAVGAAGVHLGQSDFPVDEARAVLGPAAIIGATAASPAEVARAYEEGADYVGFGPVFPTRSKSSPKSARGLDGLAEACAAAPVPIIAIGGMTHDRVREVLEAGAHGVAVLSGVAMTSNPERAAKRFRAAINGVLRTES